MLNSVGLNNEMNSWLITLTIALMRPLGMTFFFPLLKSSTLGSSLIRNGVLFALVLPLLPMLHTQPPPPISSVTLWLQYLLVEIIIGTLIGFCAAIPFWAVDMAGFLIDTLRGSTMGTLFNPAMEMQTSLFGLLFTQFLCALYLLAGGFNMLLSALYHSYDLLPPGTSLFSLSTFNAALFHFLFSEWQMLYRLCLNFSLPAVLSMLLADLALGLINRSAQQLEVFFLSMPLKSALALLLLLISLPYAFHHYLLQSENLLQHFTQLFQLIGGASR